MKLIANRQLTGVYGTVAAGDQFECSDDIGKQLVANHLAHKAEPPTVVYETKQVVPSEAPEVRPERPFRDVHVPDTQSEEVATAGDSVLSEADVQSPRTADSGRRRRRS